MASAGVSEYPQGTISPLPGAVQDVVTRAEAAALQQAGPGATVSGLDPWALERQVVKEAASAFGEHPLAMGRGVVSIAPEYIRRASVEGALEETEASGVGRAFGRSLIDYGSREPDNGGYRGV